MGAHTYLALFDIFKYGQRHLGFSRIILEGNNRYTMVIWAHEESDLLVVKLEDYKKSNR